MITAAEFAELQDLCFTCRGSHVVTCVAPALDKRTLLVIAGERGGVVPCGSLPVMRARCRHLVRHLASNWGQSEIRNPKSEIE